MIYKVMKLGKEDKSGDIIQSVQFDRNKQYMIHENFDLTKMSIGYANKIYIKDKFLYADVTFAKEIDKNKVITIGGTTKVSKYIGGLRVVGKFELNCLSLVDCSAFQDAELVSEEDE